jgi:hypothetical protein
MPSNRQLDSNIGLQTKHAKCIPWLPATWKYFPVCTTEAPLVGVHRDRIIIQRIFVVWANVSCLPREYHQEEEHACLTKMSHKVRHKSMQPHAPSYKDVINNPTTQTGFPGYLGGEIQPCPLTERLSSDPLWLQPASSTSGHPADVSYHWKDTQSVGWGVQQSLAAMVPLGPMAVVPI